MIDKRVLLALALLGPVAACNEPAQEGAAAPVEVLEGTISDDMLPVDQVRSQPPLEDPEALAQVRQGARPDAAAEGTQTDPAAEDDEDAADPAPEPAEPAPSSEAEG